MIRVFLVDDHEMFRAGLKQILADTIDIKVVGEAQSSAEALNLINSDEVDVVIADISMPGRSGVELIPDLKAKSDKLHILVLSTYSEEQYAVRTIKAGASGYLTKNQAPRKLIEAIQYIASGRKYITPDLAEQLAIEIGGEDQKQPHERLSGREFEVMGLLASGLQVSEIAKKLSLSVSTISTNRVRILEKMQLRNNAELTYYAVKNNLIE